MEKHDRTQHFSLPSEVRQLRASAGETRFWGRVESGRHSPPSAGALATDEDARRQWNENIARLRERARAAGH